MKLVVRHTLKRPWDKAEDGMAEVVEACCDGIPVGTSFAVERKDVANTSALYALLKLEYDNAIEAPLRLCPCCGAEVEVTEWEPEREYVQPHMRDIVEATTLPPDCQWSGDIGTYGTLPNDEREGGPA